MVYLIYGDQSIRVKSQLKQIRKKILPEVDDFNYVKFDGCNDLVQDAVNEASYLPLGYDRKMVVIDDAYFLSKEKTKTKIESEQDYVALKSYIESKDDACDMILLLNNTNINKKNEIYTAIEKNGKVFALEDPSPEQWVEVCRKRCEDKLGCPIDNDALYELSNRTLLDYSLLYNSVAKLSLYTDHVKYNDVIMMVSRPLEDNAFELFNYLINGKNTEALSLFRDLKVMNAEPIPLISMLANQFRLMSQIMYLNRKGYSPDEIAKELNIKTGRVYVFKKNSAMVSSKTVYRALDDLFNLDLQIKSGLVDRYYSFELFLINFKRN